MDIALALHRSVDVALYLINRGAGDDKDKAKLLCKACELDRLDVVEELVEEHKLDPNCKYYKYRLYTEVEGAIYMIYLPNAVGMR